MTRPRSALVSLADTPWYHVANRCVRRAYLCGHDVVTGQNFDRRRGWIEASLSDTSLATNYRPKPAQARHATRHRPQN